MQHIAPAHNLDHLSAIESARFATVAGSAVAAAVVAMFGTTAVEVVAAIVSGIAVAATAAVSVQIRAVTGGELLVAATSTAMVALVAATTGLVPAAVVALIAAVTGPETAIGVLVAMIAIETTALAFTTTAMALAVGPETAAMSGMLLALITVAELKVAIGMTTIIVVEVAVLSSLKERARSIEIEEIIAKREVAREVEREAIEEKEVKLAALAEEEAPELAAEVDHIAF